MATVNERLQDAEVHHAVNLQQYSTGVVRRIIAVLNRADAALFAALNQALERVDPASFTVERLEVVLGSVRALNAEAYNAIGREIPAEMRSLAAYEVSYQRDLFVATLPDQVQQKYPLVAVSADSAYAAAMSRPFQGRVLASWAQAVEPTRMGQIRNAVREGFLTGKTTSEIVKQIRGSRVNGYADGIVNKARVEVEAIVRTAVAHTASTAREEFYRANEQVIAAVEWVSTLDLRTSEMCRIRDRKKYTLDHKPVGHSIQKDAFEAALPARTDAAIALAIAQAQPAGAPRSEVPAVAATAPPPIAAFAAFASTASKPPLISPVATQASLASGAEPSDTTTMRSKENGRRAALLVALLMLEEA